MHVSFRNRLTFFFVLLVILPVLAVAAVGILIVRNSEEGTAEERMDQARLAAQGLYRDAQTRAATITETFADNDAVAAAIRDGDRDFLRKRLDDLTDRDGIARARLVLRGREPLEAGGSEAIAPAMSTIKDADGRDAGEMTLSATTAQDYVELVKRVTGFEVLVEGDDVWRNATFEDPPPPDIPLRGEDAIGGERYRITGFRAVGFDGGRIEVRVLIRARELENAISENTLGIALILLAFLACAGAFALTAARSLQLQVSRLLAAARDLGRGDFSVAVPTEGNDEFAALGNEFNSMARQLEARLQELQLERKRLQETVRRVGESLGKGLDREALLAIVVRTAVDGVGAEGGRVVLRDNGNGTLAEAARAGNLASHLAAVEEAERAAIDGDEPAERQVAGANALARPLQSGHPEEGTLGVISIARVGGPFSERQRELFEYLTNQAAISMGNVGRHETIQRQALTDELTGLFNHRRFQEVMTAEVERVRRFGHELGLVMFDLDNFKQINDMYGHLQGDLVLREVARVLRESAREIDEPARYGGEEMAVALPQTGLEGAYEFAERVRVRLEQLRVPLIKGEGPPIEVTASFGVASLPHSAKADKEALIAAADAALYRAKRSGKNRTVKAE